MGNASSSERFPLSQQRSFENSRRNGVWGVGTLWNTSSRKPVSSGSSLYRPRRDIEPSELDNLVDFLIEHPEPVFQKILLQDLPVGLLHRIMDIAGLEGARLLGSASHSLRDIASSHVYSVSWPLSPSVSLLTSFLLQTRKLQLSIKPNWVAVRKLPEPERSPAVAAVAARDKLAKEFEYLCSRPDMVEKLRNLYVVGHWKWDDLQLAGLVNDEQGCERYYEPIMQGLRRLLSQATKVQHLKLYHLYITPEGAKAIVALKSLSTLEVHSCSLPSLSDVPESSSVLNGVLDLSKGQLRQWQLFMPLTNLRVLSLFVGDCESAFPPPEVLESFNPFKTIERFAVTGIEGTDISVLSSLFRSANASDSGLKLTHLKVVPGSSGLHHAEIKDLLDALAGSPMQHLVLDGIYYAEVDLLDLISAACPELVSLTLSYRQGTRQVKSEKILWPRSSWEYAPHLANFRKLTHFRWNFHLNFEEPVLAGILGFFEDGFKEDWYDYVDPEESYSDWDAIARVLAAYSPTLTNVSFLTSSSPVLEYHISRSAEGKLIVQEEDMQDMLASTKIIDPDLVRNVTWPQGSPDDHA